MNTSIRVSSDWYVVSSGLEEFVVAGDAAAEIAKLVELRKGGSNSCFFCSDFVVGDRAERGFEFLNEIKRG